MKPKVADTKKIRLRDSINLTTYVTFLVAAIVLVAGIVIGTYSFELLRFHKFRDTWAILFLELDRHGSKIDEYLSNATKTNDADHAIKLKLSGSTLRNVSSGPRLSDTLENIGLKSLDEVIDKFVFDIGGKLYLAERKDPDLLLLWPTELRGLLGSVHSALKDSTIYVVNRQGQLLYSNVLSITKSNLTKRQLVQEFISLPMREGQIPIVDKKGRKVYGFFKEIANTNVVFFVETPESVVIDQVFGVIKKYLYSIGWVLLASIILVQWPLLKISRPIKELFRMAASISHGEFDIMAKEKSYGELNKLSNAFSLMARNLAARDVALQNMYLENQEKQRLALEMETARTIQVNLLPDKKQLGAPGIEVDGIYVPAAECAGDWFQQFYDEVKNTFYLVIADVSGHGAGSSMFTTVIATVFYDACRSGSLDVPKMLAAAHAGLQTFGRQKWHASLQILEIDLNTKSAHLHNAGHLPPFLVKRVDNTRVVKRVLAPSNVIGLEDELNFSVKKIQLGSGDVVLMMTDGLIEARNEKNKMYGPVNVRKFLETQNDMSPKGLLNDLTLEMKNFTADRKAEDDVCVLALRVS